MKKTTTLNKVAFLNLVLQMYDTTGAMSNF